MNESVLSIGLDAQEHELVLAALNHLHDSYNALYVGRMNDLHSPDSQMAYGALLRIQAKVKTLWTSRFNA